MLYCMGVETIHKTFKGDVKMTLRHDTITTYKHTRADGTTVRVTVPDAPRPADDLIDALRDNLSPEAVAAIGAYLQSPDTNDDDVNRQIRWFAQQLVHAIGGCAMQKQIWQEIGL